MRKMLKRLTGLVLIWSVLASGKDQKDDDKKPDKKDDGKQSDEKDDDSTSSKQEKKYIIDYFQGPSGNKSDDNSQDTNPQGECSIT